MHGLLPFRPCTTAVPLLRFFLTPRCSPSLPESLLLVALPSSLLVTLFPGLWVLPRPLTPRPLMSTLQCWSERGVLSAWLHSGCSVVVAPLASGAGTAAVNKLVSIRQATQHLRRVQAALSAALMTAGSPGALGPVIRPHTTVGANFAHACLRRRQILTSWGATRAQRTTNSQQQTAFCKPCSQTAYTTRTSYAVRTGYSGCDAYNVFCHCVSPLYSSVQLGCK